MNNILIVDHTSMTRSLIRSLLKECEKTSHLTFSIKEAENAQEAIELASKENFDIIFLDVCLPVLDSVNVIKAIKERCCSTMIIAVASIDEELKVEEALKNGADDYVIYPIKSEIYFHRLETYLSIVKAKRHKLKSTRKINIYTTDVFSRATKFFINSENSLAEFWEYFLSGSDKKYLYEHDVIRTLFSISEVQYKHNKDSLIYLEESVEYMYFSIINISNIPEDKLNAYLNNCPRTIVEHKIEDDVLTIRLQKVFSLVESLNLVDEELRDTIQEAETSKEFENVQEQSADSVTELLYQGSKKELKVFNYIEDDDLHDLYDYSSRLNSLMLLAGSGDLEIEDVNDMAADLEKIATLLATYSEVYVISTSLNSLASVMKTHSDVFREKSEILAPLCKGFVNDMSSWIKMSFETGAPSEDFMNDTIAVNCQTISSILTMDDAVEENHDNLDDIFDF